MERKELLMTLMIGVLLLTTAMQTVALASLSSGQVVVTKTATGPAPSSGAPVTGNSPAGSLSNLPSMVGGC